MRPRRPRPTVRARLTALYALLLGVAGALLLGLSWWLVGRHLERTLPAGLAAEATAELGRQYALALAGTLVVAVALGWTLAGRALAPLGLISRTARSVSEERLDERVELDGPPDEVRDLAESLDGMLDRLAGSFEAQRRFIANASHELRGPLAAIRAEAEVALASPRPELEELRSSAEAVVEGTERVEALLDALLALARAERGRLRREEVDLAAAARTAHALAAGEAARADVRVQLAAGPATARGDRRLLERVMANLLENAIRHNVGGGWVEVATGRRGPMAVLRVENGGERLDAEAVERLGRPFERGDRRGGGAGLGLSIVRAVVDAHRGELRLAPRAGGGLRAEVALLATAEGADRPPRSRRLRRGAAAAPPAR